MFDSMFEIWNRIFFSLSLSLCLQLLRGETETMRILNDLLGRGWNPKKLKSLMMSFIHNPSLYFQNAAKLRGLDSLPPIKNKGSPSCRPNIAQAPALFESNLVASVATPMSQGVTARRHGRIIVVSLAERTTNHNIPFRLQGGLPWS